MKNFLVTGHLFSEYQEIEKILNTIGVNSINESIDGSLSPKDLNKILMDKNNVLNISNIENLLKIKADISSKELTKNFLLNYDNVKALTFSDSNTLFVCDSWQHIGLNYFIFVYNSPLIALSNYIIYSLIQNNEINIEQYVCQWKGYHKLLLNTYTSNINQSILVSSEDVIKKPQNLIKLIERKFSFKNENLVVLNDENLSSIFNSGLKYKDDIINKEIIFILCEKIINEDKEITQIYNNIRKKTLIKSKDLPKKYNSKNCLSQYLKDISSFDSLKRNLDNSQEKVVGKYGDIERDLMMKLFSTQENLENLYKENKEVIEKNENLLEINGKIKLDLDSLNKLNKEVMDENKKLLEVNRKIKLDLDGLYKENKELLDCKNEFYLNNYQGVIFNNEDDNLKNESKFDKNQALVEAKNQLINDKEKLIQNFEEKIKKLELEKVLLLTKEQLITDIERNLLIKNNLISDQDKRIIDLDEQLKSNNILIIDKNRIIKELEFKLNIKEKLIKDKEKLIQEYKNKNIHLFMQLSKLQEGNERSYLCLKQELIAPADEIKQQLPYRVGALIIENSNSISNLRKLPSLINAEKKLHDDIESEPTPVNSSEKAQIDKVKKHLSYRLGRLLIQTQNKPVDLIKFPFLVSNEILKYKFEKKRNN